MVIFNEAPDITKNSMKMVGVIISILSNIRSESFLKLTINAPIIIQDNNPENDKSIPINVLKSMIDTPTQINIAAIHIMILLDLDLNKWQLNETKKPNNEPNKILPTTDNNGQTNKSITLGASPLAMALEIENKIEKAIKATASSKINN